MNIDQISDVVIPFEDTGEIIGLVIHMLTGIFGAIGVVVVLAATLPRKNSASTMLLLSLCWADLVFCLSAVIFGTKDLAYGGWSSGKLGCLIDTLLVLGGCFASVLTIFAITLERYLAVMYGKILKVSEIWIMIALIWVASLLIAAFPWYTDTYGYVLALQPGREICTVAWWDRHPMNILMLSLCLVTLALAVSFICFAYFMIVLKYYETQAAVRGSGAKSSLKSSTVDKEPEKKIIKSNMKVSSQSSSSHATKSELISAPKDKERMLLIKSIIISGTFIFCWYCESHARTPYLLMIIYSLSSGLPAPPFWDSFVSIAALINSAVNPVLLVTLDLRIRSNVCEFLGIKSKGK
ncbi:hypothetical protein HDV06_005185 [Boothiomyces sp. JEL0866]|nr:hypothetical protein HDV06_005185 [Boothiomyces sp. JEL0866]